MFTYGQTGTGWYALKRLSKTKYLVNFFGRKLGKTYTMLGYDLWSSVTQTNQSLYPSEDNMGIIPRSMTYLFQQLFSRKNEFQVLVSYIEIYNEKIVDLLNSNYDENQTIASKTLSIQENKQGHIVIPGLVEVEVRSISQIFEVLWKFLKSST